MIAIDAGVDAARSAFDSEDKATIMATTDAINHVLAAHNAKLTAQPVLLPDGRISARLVLTISSDDDVPTKP